MPRTWTVQLRDAQTPSEQSTILRSIKNAIVGYMTRKEVVVRAGVLETIVHLATKQNDLPIRADAHHKTSQSLQSGELVRLQALQILASVAKGEWDMSKHGMRD